MSLPISPRSFFKLSVTVCSSALKACKALLTSTSTPPLKTSELALPEVQPTQSPTDPLSPERLAFAEQVAGRPVV